MNKIELIQFIASEVCRDCGPDRDCGFGLAECDGIMNALEALDKFLNKFLATATDSERKEKEDGSGVSENKQRR